MVFFALASGIAVIIVLWILYGLFAGTWNPWRAVEGADGRPSTSKLQWFLWTVVAIFSFAAVYAARVRSGSFQAAVEIPSNLLVAMGFSTATMIAAKGITVGYLANKRIEKQKVAPGTVGLSAVFQDDDKVPDLSKIQMLAWTFIAISVYLIRLVQQVNASIFMLPDIDAPLMALMGLGQSGYVGKKLATVKTP